MSSASPRRSRLFAVSFALTTCFIAQSLTAQQAGDVAQKAKALDQQIIAESKKSPEIMANLSYLSDVIGPRLTGSAALRRANDWTAEKMKSYGLVNVHLESWLMPEGWERGIATARILEPDNGRSLAVASYGWSPGTNGKVEGEVIVLSVRTMADLEKQRGKLKGKIILNGAPKQLVAIGDIEKSGASVVSPEKVAKDMKAQPSFEEMAALRKQQDVFYQQEGVVAILNDSGKHLGLLNMGGGWTGNDRPSATRKIPTLFVSHDHYALLHRLATRPAPAKTRMELEVANKFIPGPVQVFNTVGEIKGTEKPDEFMVVGAHLDSWDLGQGTLDNGCGTCVTLEIARILAKMPAPRRTIRFILFTGEEQGLHGSRHYVDQHKDELAKMTAAIVHDTGTGRVTGLGWMTNRDILGPILEAELATLKDLGVKELVGRGGGGSDHVSFDRGGVPGCAVNQEIAGYRFGHHSQADTFEMAHEADLQQGVQVIATAALRLANLDKLLPRSAGKGK